VSHLKNRLEKDSLGEKPVPLEVYWGIHTQRALENFALSGQKVSPALIRAIVLVKKAAGQANRELGYLPEPKAQAIITACDEILAGKLSDQFPLDALQGGAGTSTNMNVNEVIANRAIELSGGTKGDYAVIHPLQDVNLHQSTNDVYPTALKVAVIIGLKELSQAAAQLQEEFQKKEKEFAAIVKIGRTEMQEAVPLTLGAEFSAFAEAVARDRWRVFKCEERVRVVNIGGTAVGTGLAAPRKYIFLVIDKLRELTGLGISRAENGVDQTANSDSLAEVSGILKVQAVNLVKISNDLRLLNLLGEIELPKEQVGSSIMPGKINPVILEAVIQAGTKAIADDGLVTTAAAAGTLQINEFLPLLAASLLEEVELLTRACLLLARHVPGIKADPVKCREYLENSPTLITAFLPVLGYERANALLAEWSQGQAQSFREFLSQKLGRELVDKTLSPYNLTALGYQDEHHT
jgi:aspartate ammonia-lyase